MNFFWNEIFFELLINIQNPNVWIFIEEIMIQQQIDDFIAFDSIIFIR